MKQFNNDLRGFTVLELMVVISVIMILSSFLFVSASRQENIAKLQRETYTLAQNLRRVEQLAVSTQTINCPAATAKIFGVHFEKSGPNWQDKYIIFGDCNKNYLRDVGDQDIQSIDLRKGVSISDIVFAPAQSYLDIVFEPPDPTVYLNAASSSAEAVITLSLKSDPAKQRQVKVNTVGRIETEQY